MTAAVPVLIGMFIGGWIGTATVVLTEFYVIQVVQSSFSLKNCC